MDTYVSGTVAEASAALQRLARWSLDRPLDQAIEGAAAVAAGLPAGARGAALCAFETAIAGRLAERAGLPLFRWLAAHAGIALDPGPMRIPVNALIDAIDPAACAEDARSLVLAGFTTLKLKVFGDVDRDVARAAAVRAAAPGVALRLDANGCLDDSAARAFLSACEPCTIAFIEQPLAATREDALAGHAALGRATRIAVALDESCLSATDVAAIAAAAAASVVVVKPMVSGLLEACRMVTAAHALGLEAIVTTTFDAAPGTLAAMSVAALLAPPRPACGLATSARIERDLASGLPAVEHGAITLGESPALGLTLDYEALAALRTGPGWTAGR